MLIKGYNLPYRRRQLTDHTSPLHVYVVFEFPLNKNPQFLVIDVSLFITKCLKSAVRLLNIVCVIWWGLDLYKEVLLVSVGQRAAELPAVKVRGFKKNSATWPGAGTSVYKPGQMVEFFFKPPTLTAGSSAAIDLQRPTVPL